MADAYTNCNSARSRTGTHKTQKQTQGQITRQPDVQLYSDSRSTSIVNGTIHAGISRSDSQAVYASKQYPIRMQGAVEPGRWRRVCLCDRAGPAPSGYVSYMVSYRLSLGLGRRDPYSCTMVQRCISYVQLYSCRPVHCYSSHGFAILSA